MDFTKVQVSTDSSSLKILAQGSDTLSVPAVAAGSTATGVVTVPHGYGSDELIFQVAVSGEGIDTLIPWQSNDGIILLWATMDSTNLKVYSRTGAFAGSQPARRYTVYYRILIP
jgi:hypothetical protein